MESIEEIITKGKTPITCDNEKCSFKGDIWWCYNGEERDCGLYKQWEKNMMMGKYYNKNRVTKK